MMHSLLAPGRWFTHIRHHWRGVSRTTLMIGSLSESLLLFGLLRLRIRIVEGRAPDAYDRAVWLHHCCKRITSRLGIKLISADSLPQRGLVVSNHLSHLDILLYGALGPIVFVAKSDLKSWPLLGRLATCGGTVFVNRQRSIKAGNAAREMEHLLDRNLPVLLFPEGTTGDGKSVLPFRSSLFEAAVRSAKTITPAAIRYSAPGVDEQALAYYGAKSFLPHLYETLSHRELTVTINFSEQSARFKDRKQAASAAYESVCQLRQSCLVNSSEWLPFDACTT